MFPDGFVCRRLRRVGIVLVLLGLFGMHGVGAPGRDLTSTRPAMAAEAGDGLSASVAAVVASDKTAPRADYAESGGRPGLTSMPALCFGVLGTLGLLLAAAGFAYHRRPIALPLMRRPGQARADRAPPDLCLLNICRC